MYFTWLWLISFITSRNLSCTWQTSLPHFLYRNFSHLFHFIILANEIPDCGMSKDSYYCVILHTAVLNISHLLICKYTMIMSMPQITLCLICSLIFPQLTKRNCLAFPETGWWEQVAFKMRWSTVRCKHRSGLLGISHILVPYFDRFPNSKFQNLVVVI